MPIPLRILERIGVATLVQMVFLIFLAGCDRQEDYISGDLKIFLEPENRSNLQFRAFEAGGGGFVMEESVVRQGVSCTWQVQDGDTTLLLELKDQYGYIEGSVKALRFPESWKGFEQLLLNVDNPNPHPVSMALTVFGPRNILTDTFDIATGESPTLRLSLLDLPLAAGHRELYIPRKIRLWTSATQHDFQLSIENLRLRPREDSIDLTCVDAFGQRIRGVWDHKVRNESKLADLKVEEDRYLSVKKKDPEWGDFFGYISGESFKASGFFRVEKTRRDGKDRWWFITPEGRPFWSLGVTCVRPWKNLRAVTKTKGREYLFEKLPPSTGPYAAAWASDSTISFFHLNLLKKYGAADRWRDRALERIQKWGLNTLGNWTEDSVLFKRRVPYTFSFNTCDKPGLDMGKRICDVFSPAWIAYTDSVLSQAAALREDPWLIGYFVDNEAGWNELDLLTRSPTSSILRDKWVTLLKERYVDLDALNRSWDSTFRSWSEVHIMNGDSLEHNTSFQKDYLRLEEVFADQYFKVISTTLKKYDPNHLYLGCRFTRSLKPDHILKAAGRYSDVITVNVYSLAPEKEQMEAWHQKTGRPLLIGEHHLPLLSERQLPPIYRAFTPEERYRHYIEYVRTFAEMPFSLGCHWYQFSDQHITGRASNGENQTIGLVDITDQPHQEMIEAIGVCSKNIYQWHSNATY